MITWASISPFNPIRALLDKSHHSFLKSSHFEAHFDNKTNTPWHVSFVTFLGFFLRTISPSPLSSFILSCTHTHTHTEIRRYASQNDKHFIHGEQMCGSRTFFYNSCLSELPKFFLKSRYDFLIVKFFKVFRNRIKVLKDYRSICIILEFFKKKKKKSNYLKRKD